MIRMSKIRVLVIDDSAVVRKIISGIFEKAEGIELVGTAMDPFIAAEKIKVLRPDVLTLDIEMPRMDGLTFLSKLMISWPMPVIMVSSLTDTGAQATIRAMQAGAVDFVLKPSSDDGSERWENFGRELVEKIKVASRVSISRKQTISEIQVNPQTKHVDGMRSSGSVIAIGASTGGTEVITKILCAMKTNIPGIVITQHMPPKFTDAFARRIDSMAEIKVKEAENGDRIFDGCAYIAPGGLQMLVHRNQSGFWIQVNDDPPVNRHKPSVDVLFNSVMQSAGSKAIGIILTGMGSDGASGLLEMKESGAFTIAQDEQSSIVFGMPREAIKIGAADKVMNIEEIIAYMHTKGV
jgi:two-component system, chemotaxis family, protein-glutamate methylesterase/glutaminase